MTIFHDVARIVSRFPGEFACGAGLLVLLLLGWVILLATRCGAIRRSLDGLLRGKGGGDLEDVIVGALTRLGDVEAKAAELKNHLRVLDAQQRLCLQRVGLVRYDAFQDVGGGQSFSVALLDADLNGVVMTGILGRTEGRCYSKPIVHGTSEFNLSEEEKQAIQQAKEER